MLEEVEHRNVAFDVYEHLYGDYLYRALVGSAPPELPLFALRCALFVERLGWLLLAFFLPIHALAHRSSPCLTTSRTTESSYREPERGDR
jgi:hypothetical protein